MSTIFRDREYKVISDGYLTEGDENSICGLCAGPASAYWVGHKLIAVCYRCAVHVLPALIADAMRARGRNLTWYLKTKCDMVNRFQECAALALTREKPDPGLRELEERQKEERIKYEIDAETNGGP